jgi:hypothetical protein
MRVLLTSTDATPTAHTILVLPQDGDGDSFETLSGESVEAGFVTEAENELLTEAVNGSARERAKQGINAKALAADIRWLHNKLAECEHGSKLGLILERGGYVLDDSEATRIDRAKGLKEGDRIAVGPAAKSNTLINAHGMVIAIDGKQVEVEIDAGDRDRLERATGMTVRESETFHIGFLEKLA